MQKIKSILPNIMSAILTGFGLLSMYYYLKNDMSIITFIFGVIGYIIVFIPTYETWKKFFKDNTSTK
jgi:ABC-type spermidine/putrescine transport system permease subunit II